MIYLDSSVVLAHLLAENRRPAAAVWDEDLVSSRLLEYEVWNRINVGRLTKTHAEEVRVFMERISFLELTPAVLERALEPFPVPVRTLDGLHLASIEHVRGCGQAVKLATFDNRMINAARSLGIDLLQL